MKQYHQDRLDQMSAKLIPSKAESDLATWIEERTLVAGKPWSYEGHEYQKFITDYPARDKYIQKCSQIGMSALSIRWALGFGQVNPGTTVLYSLPTAGFAAKFGSARFNKLLRSNLVNKERLAVPGSDSATYKAMINGSEIYFLGGVSASGQISIPADCLIFDEVNFVSDLAITSMLQSRLTHSKHKISTYISTPTLEDYGVSDGYNISKQHVEMQKCSKCNHKFHVDYHKHVEIPGFLGKINEFNFQNKRILQNYAVKDAYILCPKCKRPIDTSIQNREWVCVNNESLAESAGFWITPFSAPDIITPADLIRSACKYVSYSDFENFALGNPFSDSTTGLSKDEIESCFVGNQILSVPYSVMGLDMGGLCACTIGIPNGLGAADVVHSEMIPLKDVKKRVAELKKKFNVIHTVIDAYPYTETVLRMQLKDRDSHAAIFGRSLELYVERTKDDDEGKALSGMRVVNISRERMLDYTASVIREGSVRFINCEGEKELFKIHLTDLKRAKILDKDGEVAYKWTKSANGEDHYFFSMVYMLTAALMKGFGERFIPTGHGFPLVRSFVLDEDLDYASELARR